MSNFEQMRRQAHTSFNQLRDSTGRETKILEYGEGLKYVIFSDIHVGDGSDADNFVQNEAVMLKALRYYFRDNYDIILLGDIEEFHQFTLYDIKNKYLKGETDPSLYDILLQFEKEKIHRVFGNHDIDWTVEDPLTYEKRAVAYEAIKMKKKGDLDNKFQIMLTHGHQAEESYEKDIHIVRIGTAIFRSIERGLKIPSKSILEKKPDHKDEIYDLWAEDNKIIFICGHTHCPIFSTKFIDYPWMQEQFEQTKQQIEEEENGDRNREKIRKLTDKKDWLKVRIENIERRLDSTRGLYQAPDHKKEPLSKYYFNAGACFFEDAISNLEIDGDDIRLVYWPNKDQKRNLLWEDKISNILA